MFAYGRWWWSWGGAARLLVSLTDANRGERKAIEKVIIGPMRGWAWSDGDVVFLLFYHYAQRVLSQILMETAIASRKLASVLFSCE